MSDHPLCCECEACLNGAGGYTLPGAGRTVPTPKDAKRRRTAARLNDRRAALTALAHRHAQQLETARRELRKLDGRSDAA